MKLVSMARRRKPLPPHRLLLAAMFFAGLGVLWSGSLVGAKPAQQNPPAINNGIAPSAIAQIQALLAEKAARTLAQRRMDSRLVYAQKMANGQAIASGVPTLEVNLPYTNDNKVVLDVRAEVSDALLGQMRAL